MRAASKAQRHENKATLQISFIQNLISDIVTIWSLEWRYWIELDHSYAFISLFLYLLLIKRSMEKLDMKDQSTVYNRTNSIDGLNSRSHQYVFFAEPKTVSFEVLTDEVLPCKICAYRASQMKYFKVSWRYFRIHISVRKLCIQCGFYTRAYSSTHK